MTGIRITIHNLKLVVRVQCWGGGGVQVCRLWGEKKKEERRWEKLGPSSIGERPVSSERETTWQSLWVMWGHPGSLQGKRREFCGSYLGSRKEWLTIWWCFWRNVKKSPALRPEERGWQELTIPEGHPRSAQRARAMAEAPAKETALPHPGLTQVSFLTPVVVAAARKVGCIVHDGPQV